MKGYAERDCSKLFLLYQTKYVSASSILRQCHIHFVLVQLYVEPVNDFNLLFVKSFLALSL